MRRQLLLMALQAAFIGGLDHLMYHEHRGREADLQPLLAGGKAKTQSDMSFAGPACSQWDDVLALADEIIPSAASLELAKGLPKPVDL